jgi:[citrate (pro-3S)-lyase] ligase
MNCNPFTLGHQFLIETAASQVEYLYVFVVEEDKSFFRFQDRFRLVTEGTKHIKNVKVLPSGEYMISLSTFPGYFNKDNIDCTTVDATQDLEIFCRYIAPCLNIRCRFVGSEPVDMVTNGYNLQMKKILKKYDLECIEIERIQESDKVISASTVRNLLKEKNWKEIEKIVPKSTLLFLRENYDSAN